MGNRLEGSKRSEHRRRQLRASVRGMMHALILAAIVLVIGVTSLTASAEEAAPAPAQVPGVPAVTAVPAPTTLTAPADVKLRVGESVSVDGGALKLTMLAVTEDSRCPKDVLCVWSGRAVVALHAELDGADAGDVIATLMPGGRGPQAPSLDATVGRYTISLTDLQPYPDRSHPEPTLETVATLAIVAAP